MLRDAFPVFPNRPLHRGSGLPGRILKRADQSKRFLVIQINAGVLLDDLARVIAQMRHDKRCKAAPFQFGGLFKERFVFRMNPGNKPFASLFHTRSSHAQRVPQWRTFCKREIGN